MADPDLTPIMNIAFMLILAMLTLSAALPLGLISVEAPQISPGGGGGAKNPDDAKPLNLTVFLTKKGISIGASGATLDGAKDTPPRPGEALFPMKKKGDKDVYDFKALRRKLSNIKKGFPEENTVLIIADEDVIYDDIIKTMDAAREDDDGEILFPGVAFSAGIVG